MTDKQELLWGHAIDLEDFDRAQKISEEHRKTKVSPSMGRGGVKLCSYDQVDPITGKRCILLDNHGGDGHRVDTPLLDSDEWEWPEWRAYEAAFGRHVTPSE